MTLAAMLIMATAASADMAQKKVYDDGAAFFINGKQVIYVYPNVDTTNVDPDDAKIYMRKSICSAAESKKIVDIGYKIVWIYPKGESATIVTLDSCD